MFDKELLGRMKPDAWIVTSRAGLVDTDALVAALDSNQIGELHSTSPGAKAAHHFCGERLA
jgi:phosphoglycerate dehydrogenase-like enzyme